MNEGRKLRESEYLRLALMFGDNNASTFKKNLEKMIMLVLYDSYDEPQNVISIIEKLKDYYRLDFSEHEILDANKEYELIKENKELLNTVEDARSEGERNRAERLADQVLLKTIILYWGIALLLAAIGIYFIVVAIDKSIDGSLTWLKLASESAPAMLDLLLSIIIGIADFVVIRKFLCDLDRESIRDRLIRRFMK